MESDLQISSAFPRSLPNMFVPLLGFAGSQEKLRNQFLTFFVMRATTQYRPPFWYALKNKEEHKMMYGDSIRSKYCKCTALYFVVLPCNLR